MMAMRNQKQVMAAMDAAAGRAVRDMSDGYRKDVGPLIAAIRKAKSEKGLLRSLGPATLRRMKTDALGEALALEGTKAAAAGVVSAVPGKYVIRNL